MVRPLRAIYTVTEACRILRPGLTPRRIHYWLHTGLLGDPVRSEARGRPTLLSFDQVLKLMVLQRLRDELGFSLQRARTAVAWVLEQLVEERWGELHFFRTGRGEIGVRDRSGRALAIGGQRVIEETLTDALTAFLHEARKRWEAGEIPIDGFPELVADASVMGGAPVIRGTRIETAFVAHVGRAVGPGEIVRLFPHVRPEGLREALRFEGVVA
jgi:uncharacterized protein (DUF433 family)